MTVYGILVVKVNREVAVVVLTDQTVAVSVVLKVVLNVETAVVVVHSVTVLTTQMGAGGWLLCSSVLFWGLAQTLTVLVTGYDWWG